MKSLFALIIVSLSLMCSGCSEAKNDVLHIYNWGQSLPIDLLHDFERETGIKVIYDNFDNNDTLEAKLLLGISGYDIVFPSAWPYFNRQAKAGLYHKLDPTKFHFLHKFNPGLLRFFTKNEPGLNFGIPYMWGVLAFAYNRDVVSKIPNLPLNSYATIYEANNLKKLSKCGVAFPDEALDIFPYIMRYLNTTSLDSAVQRMRKLKPYIRRFDLVQSVQELASGSLCFIQAPLGPAFRAKIDLQNTESNVRIAFSYPKEGIPLWMDVVAIPKNPPHLENAYKFINFIYRTKNMARISNYLYEFNLMDETTSHLNPQLQVLRKQLLAKKIKFVKVSAKSREHVRALNRSLEQIIFHSEN